MTLHLARRTASVFGVFCLALGIALVTPVLAQDSAGNSSDQSQSQSGHHHHGHHHSTSDQPN
jgi:hypothetical protein